MKFSLQAMVLAKRAYHPKNINEAKLNSEELSGFFNKSELQLKTFNVDHDFGFVANDKEKIVIALRGTDDKMDWFSNFVALKLDPKLMGFDSAEEISEQNKHVHLGFLVAWRRMKKEIEPYINLLVQSLPPNVKLIVTGHSRGGALAHLCADKFARVFGKETELYTYGSPRVGNSSYKSFINSISNLKIIRIRNRKDVIPMVPMEAFGFTHVTKETNIGSTWYDRMWPVPPFTKKQVLAHHRDNAYIRSIKKAKKKRKLK